MARLNLLAIAFSVCATLAFDGTSVSAQGLIFNLPEDGKAVEYEGTLTQSTGPDDQAPLQWTIDGTFEIFCFAASRRHRLQHAEAEYKARFIQPIAGRDTCPTPGKGTTGPQDQGRSRRVTSG